MEGKLADSRGCRVLVVDDNKDAAKVLSLMLKMLSYDVRTAHDGFAALELAEAFRPEFVLMDIGMPKLDGCETARRIRETSWGKEIVLVALTGWSQEEDVRRSKDAGFDHHFVKPLEPTALQELLASRQPSVSQP